MLMSLLRAVSQITTIMWVSGCEPCWFSKLDVMGGHLSSTCLKNWGTPFGVEPFAPQREAVGFEFPPVVGHHTGGEIDSKIVSQPLQPILMWCSSCLPGAELSLSQSLGFFKEEIIPYVAVDSVCPWEEVSSVSSYIITILNWPVK